MSKPFREVIMEIQKKSPRAERVVMISDYLKKLSEQETALHYPISSIFEKHVDRKDLKEA